MIPLIGCFIFSQAYKVTFCHFICKLLIIRKIKGIFYMKKLVRTSMTYMIAGLASGLFYREFTKINDFQGKSQLGTLHTHILILGMFFFLIVLLLEKAFKLSEHKHYKKFYALYNSGLGITLLMMLTHGIMTVLGKADSPMIAGIAGLGHIFLTIGLGFFFAALMGQVGKQEKA